jgi:hypothetical protein
MKYPANFDHKYDDIELLEMLKRVEEEGRGVSDPKPPNNPKNNPPKAPSPNHWLISSRRPKQNQPANIVGNNPI